jgi:hypothetical protein
VGPRSIVGGVCSRRSRVRSGIAATARSNTSALAASTPAMCSSSTRRASSPAVVGAGGSATVRRRLPEASARSLSRSDMKSPRVSIISTNDITSPPPVTPRRRCLTGPICSSNESVAPSAASTSETSSNPAVGVNEGSSARISTPRSWPAILFIIQVPFAVGVFCSLSPRVLPQRSDTCYGTPTPRRTTLGSRSDLKKVGVTPLRAG